MPGDIVPFESEVLLISAQTGWLPQDIEEMGTRYYLNVLEARNVVEKAARARQPRGR